MMLFIFLFVFQLQLHAQKKVYWWTDTSSSHYVNHRVIDMIESGDQVICLSRVTDSKYQNPYLGISSLSSKGGKIDYRVVADVRDIYEIKKLILEPNNNIRIYGTKRLQNIMAPFIHIVKPNGSPDSHADVIVTVAHYVGDVMKANNTDYILAKAIRGSQTNTYNMFVYRIEMSVTDQQKWRCKLESVYNEEARKLVILPDSGIVLLAKRYSDLSQISYVPVLYRIDGNGNKIWEKVLPDYAESEDINIAGSKEFIYFVNSIGNETNGKSGGDIVRLNLDGKIDKVVHIENLNAKGLLILKSGNLLLYGGFYTTAGYRFIKKARVTTYTTELNQIKSSFLDELDFPDASFPSVLAADFQPTSSDILTAIQLKDERVLFGGRVYMPLYIKPKEILFSERTNQNFLIFSTPDGTWDNSKRFELEYGREALPK